MMRAVTSTCARFALLCAALVLLQLAGTSVLQLQHVSAMAMGPGAAAAHPLLQDWRAHYKRWHSAVADELKPKRAGAPRNEANDGEPSPNPLYLLDEFIGGVQQCFGFVGLTAAVVSQGGNSGQSSLLYRNAFGVRDLTTREPVDVHTLFGIGSTTKAFTATLMAAAVDAGAANWTDLVRKYVPAFTMFDAFANSSVTLKDAMCHRTGVPRYDAIWATGINESRLQGVLNVGQLAPNLPFRDAFEYNNWLWSTAGAVVEAATGAAWADLLQDRILTPLGMTQSTPNLTAAIAAGNYATPNVYCHTTGAYVALPVDANRVLEVVAPAGAMNSNAQDMVQWMLLHLQNGTFDGQELVSAANLAVTKRAYTALGMGRYRPWSAASETDQTYGFGWVNGQYRGYRQYWHDGGTLGHTTLLTFLPDVQVSAFVSINGVQGFEEVVERLITDYAFDVALGLEPWLTVQSACAIKDIADAEMRAAPTPAHPLLRAEEQRQQQQRDGVMCDADDARAGWTEQQRDMHARCMAALRDVHRAAPVAAPAAAPRHSGTSPYAGTYTSPYAGVVTIGPDGVAWQYNAATGVLQATSQPHVYLVTLNGWFATVNAGAQIPLVFARNSSGQIEAIGMAFGEGEAPYVFYGPN